MRHRLTRSRNRIDTARRMNASERYLVTSATDLRD